MRYTRAAAVLAAAVVVGAALPGAALGQQSLEDDLADALTGVRAEAGLMHDENVFRARDGDPRHADQVLTLRAAKDAPHSLLGTNARVLLGGFVGAEGFASNTKLSRAFVGGRAELQYRAAGTFSAPTFALFARVSGDHCEAGQRSGWRDSIGVSILQPVTDRIVVFGALARSHRRAESVVFEGAENSLRLHVDYAPSATSTLYAGADLRRGDVVSSGPPTLDSIDIAEALVLDEAAPDPQTFAYRFQAKSAIFTLGWNVTLGTAGSLDLSWLRATVRPTQTPDYPGAQRGRYVTDQFSLVYLRRF